jgi:hypothetical protein
VLKPSNSRADKNQNYLFRALREREKKDKLHLDLNRVVHWLKHPTLDEPEYIRISEFEVALMISRAIQKFVAVYRFPVRAIDLLLQRPM